MVRALPPGLGPDRPRAPGGWSRWTAEPAQPALAGAVPRPSPSTTSPACGPGTGSIVDPLVVRRTSAQVALRRAVACWRPSGPGPPGSTASPRSGWRPMSRCRFPILCERATTCPRRAGQRAVLPGSHPASCSSTTRTSGAGSATTGSSTTSPITDELALDERLLTACWAWEQVELRSPVVGVHHTELRLDGRAAAHRRPRTPRRRSAAPRPASALSCGRCSTRRSRWSPRRRGRTARCAFRAPCLRWNRGEDPSGLLAERYRERPPDLLEEGRLGGIQLGHGPRRRTTALRPSRRPVTSDSAPSPPSLSSGVHAQLATAECTIRGRERSEGSRQREEGRDGGLADADGTVVRGSVRWTRTVRPPCESTSSTTSVRRTFWNTPAREGDRCPGHGARPPRWPARPPPGRSPRGSRRRPQPRRAPRSRSDATRATSADGSRRSAPSSPSARATVPVVRRRARPIDRPRQGLQLDCGLRLVAHAGAGPRGGWRRRPNRRPMLVVRSVAGRWTRSSTAPHGGSTSASARSTAPARRRSSHTAAIRHGSRMAATPPGMRHRDQVADPLVAATARPPAPRRPTSCRRARSPARRRRSPTTGSVRPCSHHARGDVGVVVLHADGRQVELERPAWSDRYSGWRSWATTSGIDAVQVAEVVDGLQERPVRGRGARGRRCGGSARRRHPLAHADRALAARRRRRARHGAAVKGSASGSGA